MTSRAHIRILPELRAVQVERSFLMYPCLNLYFGTKYDLGSTDVPAEFVQVNLWRALKFLISADAQVVEVPEPLWLRFAPTNTALICAWRLGGIIRRQKRFVVTYSIENNDLSVLLGRGRPLPRWVLKSTRRLVRFFAPILFDRVAFGTDGARDAYAPFDLRNRVVTRVFPELPVAEPSALQDVPARDPAAVFVGRLETRKGVRALMTSWEHVERVLPRAVLTIVGDGPLLREVELWVGSRPRSRRAVGRVEHAEVGEIVASNTVLIAPSIPEGRWREQVGLPIGEALAHGLTVVSSGDTGLADWLALNNHRVVPTDQISTRLAPAILDALRVPLDRSAVRASLPHQPGRIAADQWLHSVEEDAA